jgi:hypothetical protein
MPRLPLLVAALGAALAGLLAARAPASASAATPDPCPRSAALRTGPTNGPYYATVAPFEHFSSSRTQVFPATCATTELPGAGPVRVRVREAPGDYLTPYSAVTRARGQLYLYGYRPDAAHQGAYVAAIDTRTLRERWRTRIPDAKPPGQWSYPGVLAVHGNGSLYAVYGNVLVRLDARTGAVRARRELPEDEHGTGAAYNGLIVLPDGRIAVKGVERGPCPSAVAAPDPAAPATAGALAGLLCAARNALPTPMVVVDPRDLRVRSRITPPEPVTGRITAGATGGREYVYAAGRDSLFRFRYRRGSLALDERWGPVRYRSGDQLPGTGTGLLGGFVVVQTNFLPSKAPLTVTAVSTRDAHRVFQITPFRAASAGGSWIVSKPALDAANGIVVSHDTSAGRMAALHLDPRRGFTVRWRRPMSSLAFSALVGAARDRQIVIADHTARGDEVLWLDERTGRTRARTRPLSTLPAPGNIVTPGFGDRFYFPTGDGRLWELHPVRARDR